MKPRRGELLSFARSSLFRVDFKRGIDIVNLLHAPCKHFFAFLRFNDLPRRDLDLRSCCFSRDRILRGSEGSAENFINHRLTFLLKKRSPRI